jgi:uncharacterized membrane protein
VAGSTAAYRLLYGSTYYWGLFAAYLGILLAVFTFLVPPFQKNDEPSHYYRTVSLAKLDLLCSKDAEGRYFTTMERRYADLPRVLGAEALWQSADARFPPAVLGKDFSDPAFREPVRVYDICNLGLFGYVPNALGLLAGLPFESPVAGFYLGRVAGGIFFLGCLVLALRVAPPRYRLAIVFYAALPMVLHQVSSFSYDAVQLSLFPLIFAFLTRFLTREERLPRRELVLFLALLWLAVGVKSFAYYGLFLLYFVIPAARVARGAFGYIGTTAALAALVIPSIVAVEVLYLSRSGLIDPLGDGPIRPRQQVELTLSDPMTFAAASLKTAQLEGEELVRQGVGVFGWAAFEVNIFVVYLAVLVAGLLCYGLARGERPLIRPLQLAVLWAALMVVTASVLFALYVVWSPVGAPSVSGLQGRYFVGLVPFGILAACQTVAGIGGRAAARLLAFGLAALALASMLAAVLGRYY